MHTANNSYIEILKQSLTKKIELLDTIMALNVLQKDMLENPDLDPDELEENLNHKADLVEQLSKLDDGFSQIYDRVRADLTENRGAYSEDVYKRQILHCTDCAFPMTILPILLVEKSVTVIQTQQPDR